MKEKYIAITFDDGPNKVTTPLVLKKLKKYGVVASFFLVGNNIIKSTSKYAVKAFRMGCELCNHSKTHSAFPSLSEEEINEEIRFTNEKIKKLCKIEPKFFRPPYIAYDKKTFDNVPLTFICGVGSDDWDMNVSVKHRIEKTISQCSDGTIILLHDSFGNKKTVKALDTIIPELLKQGYKFVTVSDLFRLCSVEPKAGVIYSNVYQES